MLQAIISLVLIFVFLAVSEVYWRKRKVNNESSRRWIHIVVGTFIAFWPYYMSYKTIVYCAIALFVVIFAGRFVHYIKLGNFKSHSVGFINRQLKFIESIHLVDRRSWGDLIFPITVGFLALAQPSKYIFTIAILNVALADGIASIIGCKYGKSNKYKMFEQEKSIVGSLTFWFVSFLIIVGVKLLFPGQSESLSWSAALYLPPILALTESFAVYGTDDFMVPVVTLIILSWF